MSRTLPKNKTDKQRLIIACCQDYFGKGQNSIRSNQIALWIMGKRSGINLTDEEKSDMWAIKENLEDLKYTVNLCL